MDQQYKLLKLNGEYVKLYVTTNSSLPKLLKNSGSLVVYHEEDNIHQEYSYLTNISSNYLYLGNELIAGGWGFNNKEQKDYAIYLLNYLPGKVDELDSILSGEINDRISDVAGLYDTLNNYVKKNSDIASNGSSRSSNNLYILHSNLNKDAFNVTDQTKNNKLYVKDILNLLHPAEYENIKVVDTETRYSTGFFVNNQLESVAEDIVIRDGVSYVPINSILSRADIKFKSHENDSGGINGAKISIYMNTYYFNQNTLNGNISVNTSRIISDNTTINSNGVTYDQLNINWETTYRSNEDWEKYMWFNDIDKTYNVISKCMAKIKSTPTSKYKYYPLVNYSEDNADNTYLSNYITSTENAIQEHYEDISVDNIKARYYVFYNNPIENDLSNEIETNKSFDFKKFDNRALLIDDYIDINYDFTNKKNHFISIALPRKNYDIKNIFIYKYGKRYNITGLFKSIIMNLSLNPFKYDENNLSEYYFIYMLSSSKLFNGKCTIRIEMNQHDNSTEQYTLVPINTLKTNPGLYELFDIYTNFIPNDNFDSLHWVNGYGKEFIDWISSGIENPMYTPDEMYLQYLGKDNILYF